MCVILMIVCWFWLMYGLIRSRMKGKPNEKYALQVKIIRVIDLVLLSLN